MDHKYELKDLLIHSKTKKLLEIVLRQDNDKPVALVHKTEDGFKLGKQVVEAEYMINFPALTGNLPIDTLKVLKHFKTHGYRSVKTVSAVSKGIKFS